MYSAIRELDKSSDLDVIILCVHIFLNTLEVTHGSNSKGIG